MKPRHYLDIGICKYLWLNNRRSLARARVAGVERLVKELRFIPPERCDWALPWAKSAEGHFKNDPKVSMQCVGQHDTKGSRSSTVLWQQIQDDASTSKAGDRWGMVGADGQTTRGKALFWFQQFARQMTLMLSDGTVMDLPQCSTVSCPPCSLYMGTFFSSSGLQAIRVCVCVCGCHRIHMIHVINHDTCSTHTVAWCRVPTFISIRSPQRFQGLFSSIYVMLLWLLCTVSKHNFNSRYM